MAEAPIWPVATDALIADTTHLTDAEFGAYMRLMIAQWRAKGQPLDFPAEKLARICGTPARHWAARWAAIADLFDNSQPAGRVSQKRVVEDHKSVSQKIMQAREAGARGGAAKSRKTKERHMADATNPPIAEAKRNDSDTTNYASGGSAADGVADRYQSINHKPLRESPTTNYQTLPPRPEPADEPEPGGGFFEDEGDGPDPEEFEPDAEPGLGSLDDIPAPPARERWAVLGEDLLSLTGLDARPKPVSTSIVRQWLADWSEDDIRAAVSDAVERETYDAGQVGNLKYFEPAIRRRVETRDAEQRQHAAAFWAEMAKTRGAAARFVGLWRDGGFEWEADKHGPAPDQPGYLGPDELAGPRDQPKADPPRRVHASIDSFIAAAGGRA